MPDNAENKTLREEEIRPKNLIHDQAEHFANDVRRMLQHKNEFISVRCPACNSDQYRKAFEKYGFSYVICSSCSTMYVNPRPTPALLEMYYANSENYAYWSKYIFPASENARREKISRPRAEKVADICKRNNIRTKTLIDIGAGFGTFCEEVRRMGLFENIIAVEPTPELSRTCREKGLKVIQSHIENAEIGSNVADVVTCFEAIEHMFSPKEFISSSAALLAKGGILVITCPNVKGFDILMLQELSDSVDIEHLNYFHPASLSRLLSMCNFEILEVSTPGKLDAELVRKKVINKEFDITGHHFLRQVLIEEWERLGNAFQQFLADNHLSSHMWLVARKLD